MDERKIVLPGEIIIHGEDFLPGDFVRREGDYIISNRYGLAEIEGRLVKVIPLSGVYNPRKGNLIIGHVISINYRGWIIDFDGHYNGFLSLNEVPKFINKGELRDYLDYGEVVYAKIVEVEGSNVELSLKFKGLGKLSDGQIISINPFKIPRLIGKEGSMINLVKSLTNTQIIAGQNGVVWIKGKNIQDEIKAKKIIKFIEDNSFVSGLTDKVEKFSKDLEGEND
ncbi:MAG: exosome complex RNA-binding protein Rrp4 [Candidatus Pacearchaeota archaeon]